ncbi:T9SS type A sorting domain-containing protein, partial [Maribellus sediminis]|uniref:T9SS type A sorting domain-containing protein n=1 Tax=Maribellus sediminis TaxID=2696285 RepID=UPI001430D344
CSTGAEIASAFSEWLGSVSYDGGCNATIDNGNPTAPDSCGGEITVVWTVSSDCESDVMDSAVFVVTAAPAVSLTPPANDTLDACSTGAEIASAFSEWLDGVSYDGGCNSTIDNGNPSAPDSCGGEVTVVWTVSSDCETDVMDSAVFVVTAAPAVSLTPPANDTLDACTTGAEIASAFSEWLGSVSYDGGCNSTIDNGNPSAPDSCGGEITVVWTVSSDCESDVMDSAVFVVTAAPVVTLTPPANDTIDACATESEVASAFAGWLAEVDYDGGCNSSIDDGNPTAPDECGGEVTVYWTVSSDCEADVVDSATFVVQPDTTSPVITITIVQDSTCNSDPEATATYYDDCLGTGDASLQSLNKVAVDPSDPNQCDELWIYTFYAEDSCGNSATATDTLFRFTESEGDCETAFGRLPEPDLGDAPWTDDIGSRCFLDEPDTAIFNRWGWTNRIKVGQDSVYVMDVYAGAGQCDLSKGTWVGTVTLSFDGSTMHVFYDLEDGYVISEAHIYAGYEMYPVRTNGKHKGEYTVAPGQYSVVWENAIPSAGLVVDLTGVSDGDYIFVIVHSVVCIPTCDCPETDRTLIANLSSENVELLYAAKGNGKKNAEITTDVGELEVGELKVFPNPFTEKVTFEFVSAKDAYGTLDIYSLTGQRVARILDRQVIAGEMNKVFYEPDHDVSGVYLYRLDLDGDVQVGRIIYK